MSDVDSDTPMDDAPAGSKDITFSSGNDTKGKRTAANLPVEAEDTLPWVEVRLKDMISLNYPC